LSIRFAPAAGVGSRVSGVVAPTPAAPPPVAKKITIPEPIAEAPKPVAKSEPKTVPFSPFGKSSKKGSETPPSPHAPLPTPPAKQPGVVGGVDIPIGSAGVTGIEGDFPYTIYIDRMKTLIGQRWLRPQVSGGIVATVSFVIDRD